MKSFSLYIFGLVAALSLSSCNEIPPSNYFDRGAPESLLDVSSEVINLPIQSDVSVQEVVRWINQDQPTRADLYCMDSDPLCSQVRGALQQFGVPVQYYATGGNSVALIYDRVLARDCENRYIDNRINPYNLNHPTFGCTIASNIVQHVTDKREFTSPALVDYRDADKVIQNVKDYGAASDLRPAKLDTNFEKIRPGSGGSN